MRKLRQTDKTGKGWLLPHNIKTSETKPEIQIGWAHFLPKDYLHIQQTNKNVYFHVEGS